MNKQKLIDDALARVTEYGTVGAMRWLAEALTATPAAASAGAAGTIDRYAVTIWDTDGQPGAPRMAKVIMGDYVSYADHLADKAAAVAEIEQKLIHWRTRALEAEGKRRAGQAQATEGAAVYTAEQMLATIRLVRAESEKVGQDKALGWKLEELVQQPAFIAKLNQSYAAGMRDAKALYEAGRSCAATAPVSAAPSFDSVKKAARVMTAIDDYLHIQTSERRDAIRSALLDAIAAPQSAGTPVSADDQFCDANCTWLDHAPGCVRAEAAPVSAAEDSDLRQTRAETADGQDLPALTRYGFDGTLGGDFGEEADGPYVRLDDVQVLLAMRQPDPAGEWVKRADLAMGQQGDLLHKLRGLLSQAVDRINPRGTIEPGNVAVFESAASDTLVAVHDVKRAIADVLYIAAKQAGKE